MNKNNKHRGHSPADLAIFGILNASLFGFLLSLSMFNKRYEPSNFSYWKKIKFTLRNMMAISALHGLNQYFINHFKLEENKKIILGLCSNNYKIADLLICFISISIPTYLTYKIYFFRNDFILIEKKYFVIGGLILFLFDYLNAIKNTRKNH